MVSDVPVEAEDLTKRFGNVIAVEGISFSVKKEALLVFWAGMVLVKRRLCRFLWG